MRYMATEQKLWEENFLSSEGTRIPRTMLLDEKWFKNSGGFDSLFSLFLVQNDAVNCIEDGRKWAAEYFQNLAETYGETTSSTCLQIADSFRKVSVAAAEMRPLMGLQSFGSRSVREKLGELIDRAKEADTLAYEKIQALLKNIP